MKLPFRYNFHKAKRQEIRNIEKQIEEYPGRYGFPPPKYLKFIKEMLDLGLKVKMYLPKRGKTKYLFVHDDKDLVKIRFSNHRPARDMELKEDCDYYVGVSHTQVRTTEEISYLIKSKFKLT